MTTAPPPVWEEQVLAVVRRGESILPYIQKGLVALNESPDIAELIKVLPVLKPWAEKLLGLIPVVGEISSALALIDFILEHGEAVIALGAALHFAPADWTYKAWQDDKGDTGF